MFTLENLEQSGNTTLGTTFLYIPHCYIAPSPVYSAVFSQALVAFQHCDCFFSSNGMAGVPKVL